MYYIDLVHNEFQFIDKTTFQANELEYKKRNGLIISRKNYDYYY